MKCSAKFYGMQVSMTRQYGDFKKLIFTTITHDNKKNWSKNCRLHIIRESQRERKKCENKYNHDN